MITCAITNSPNKQLTLNEIYNWISDHYPYFKSANNGWKVCSNEINYVGILIKNFLFTIFIIKNSIRHNLSANNKFVRVPRPINEPGKGSYWTVDFTKKYSSNVRKCRYKNSKISFFEMYFKNNAVNPYYSMQTN